MLLDSKELALGSAGRMEESSGLRQHGSALAPKVAVVTMTLARTPAEGATLQRALHTLSQSGLPIYVGEGGSDRAFVAELSRVPHLQICPLPTRCKPSLVKQVRAAVAGAESAAVDYVLYTEPDKVAFFRNGLLRLAASTTAETGRPADLVIAARSSRGFASFPAGQRTAERYMNQLCSEALGQAGDYTYGPMLISQRLLPYMQLIPSNLDWGWRFFLMAVAHQLRFPIRLSVVGSQCPRAQRNEDDGAAREYRLRQLVQNVTGLANGWTSLLDHQFELPPVLLPAA